MGGSFSGGGQAIAKSPGPVAHPLLAVHRRDVPADVIQDGVDIEHVAKQVTDVLHEPVGLEVFDSAVLFVAVAVVEHMVCDLLQDLVKLLVVADQLELLADAASGIGPAELDGVFQFDA